MGLWWVLALGFLCFRVGVEVLFGLWGSGFLVFVGLVWHAALGVWFDEVASGL